MSALSDGLAKLVQSLGGSASTEIVDTNYVDYNAFYNPFSSVSGQDLWTSALNNLDHAEASIQHASDTLLGTDSGESAPTAGYVTTPSGVEVNKSGSVATDFLNKIFGVGPLSDGTYTDAEGNPVSASQTGGVNAALGDIIGGAGNILFVILGVIFLIFGLVLLTRA